jgi:tRNA U38,U39,U40 pseudouridine synthase TruA
MPTYKLTIEYEGTRYSGWQAQGNTPKTIQGRLLKAARDVISVYPEPKRSEGEGSPVQRRARNRRDRCSTGDASLRSA